MQTGTFGAGSDIKAWLIGWDRLLKTQANYHGLLYGIFAYAVEQGYLTANPCARTAPSAAASNRPRRTCGFSLRRSSPPRPDWPARKGTSCASPSVLRRHLPPPSMGAPPGT